MNTPNFVNRSIFRNDNLPNLRSLDSETIDLIITDPPFAKGKGLSSTPEDVLAAMTEDPHFDPLAFQKKGSWKRDTDAILRDRIRSEFPGIARTLEAAHTCHGPELAAFLYFLAARILEMRRILKPRGSIYLHCNVQTSHYLKHLMDAIFGSHNFRNEIIWAYKPTTIAKDRLQNTHDIILFYTKTPNYLFNTECKKIQIAPGYVYRDARLDTWIDIPTQRFHEITGYPFQQPVDLYERIILQSSQEGDFVMDPFCGCGTAPVAAEKHNRQWIAMDIWSKSISILGNRIHREVTLENDLSPVTIYIIHKPLKRTDLSEKELEGISNNKKSKKRIKEILLEELGLICQGCNHHLPDERQLTVDHIHPISKGGADEIENRTLLCYPCNQLKGNKMTLPQLQAAIRKSGKMAPPL